MSEPDRVDEPAAAEDDSSPEQTSLPGAHLRAAREARGLSVADVAQVIRFSVRQIEAMERDDYAALPSATLVRGYLRNYARHLKLDPQPLIAMLDRELNPPQQAEVRPPANIGEAEVVPPLKRVSPRTWQLAGAAVVLVAVVVGAYVELSSPRPGATNRAASAVSPAEQSVAAPNPVVVAASADPTAAAPVTSGGPAAGPLLLEFDGQSWIEVIDADKRKVLSGEYGKGARQVVDGRPPFQLWVGRASVVRVTYGERGIDLKPHTREEVARFTVE